MVQNLSDLVLILVFQGYSSSHPMVQLDPTIYDFLLVFNNNYMSICDHLGVIATGKFSPIVYH